MVSEAPSVAASISEKHERRHPGEEKGHPAVADDGGDDGHVGRVEDEHVAEEVQEILNGILQQIQTYEDVMTAINAIEKPTVHVGAIITIPILAIIALSSIVSTAIVSWIQGQRAPQQPFRQNSSPTRLQESAGVPQDQNMLMVRENPEKKRVEEGSQSVRLLVLYRHHHHHHHLQRHRHP